MSFLYQIRSSCKEILYYWLRGQLPFGEDVADVLADVLLGGLEQVRQLGLIQPNGLAFHANFDTGGAVGGGIAH